MRSKRPHEGSGNLQNRAIEFVLFLTLPAAAGIWVLSDEIIRVLYERGAFSEQNTAVVASILAIYGLGLPGFVLIKALQPPITPAKTRRRPCASPWSRSQSTPACRHAFPDFRRKRDRHRRSRCRLDEHCPCSSPCCSARGHLVIERSLITRTLRLLVASAVMAAMLVYLSGRWSAWLTPQSPLFDQLLALAV